MSTRKFIYLGPYVEVAAPGCSKHDIYDWTGGAMHAEDADEGVFAAMPNLREPKPPREFSLSECQAGVESFGLGAIMPLECKWLQENYTEAIRKVLTHPDVESAEIRWGSIIWYS